MKSKIAVIGAGISGLSIARLLKDNGYDVIVFEKENQLGGLIKCSVENGVLFHRVGGHVFNTKNKAVSNWFWKHFDKNSEFISTKRNAKIWMGNKYIGYPIENHLYQLPYEKTTQIILDLLSTNSNNLKNSNSFDEFLQLNFGNGLYELYFKPYNYKIWHFDLALIPLPWLKGKLPMPNLKDIILNNIYKEEEETMVHSTFFYPRKRGSSFIIDKLSKDLFIENNCEIKSIEYENKRWKIHQQFFDSIIFTGDVRTLHNLIHINDQKITNSCLQTEALLSRGTSNVLCYTDTSDLSWLYLPEANTESHRIIYTGNFSPNNNVDERLTCTVEFSGIVSENQIKEAITHLPGNLCPIAFNYEPNSYIIQQKNTRQLISNLKDNLQPYKFFLLGRFAEWEYYNMDTAIEAAMNLIEKQF
jgi:protoporphyrinogen oxidase